jgi:DNA-directed RNA polymerase specialized sigma54-like protein
VSKYGFSQRLELRQSQALIMTPQLQQAIKMLQLSNIELADFVEAEIEQNPLLEHGERDGEEAPIAETDPVVAETNGASVVLAQELPGVLPAISRAMPPSTGALNRARRATAPVISAVIAVANPNPGRPATAAPAARTCPASTRPRRTRGRCAST